MGIASILQRIELAKRYLEQAEDHMRIGEGFNEKRCLRSVECALSSLFMCFPKGVYSKSTVGEMLQEDEDKAKGKTVTPFTAEQEQEGSFVRDHDLAFRNAINAGILTISPTEGRNCVDDWIYMYSKAFRQPNTWGGVDVFKHKDTKAGRFPVKEKIIVAYPTEKTIHVTPAPQNRDSRFWFFLPGINRK